MAVNEEDKVLTATPNTPILSISSPSQNNTNVNINYTQMATSVSSTSSSYLSSSEVPPCSININNSNNNIKINKVTTPNRGSPISQSLNSSNINNNDNDDDNDVFDDQNDDITDDLSNVEGNLTIRRSSKRAMSSSLDNNSKLKTRISLIRSKQNITTTTTSTSTESSTATPVSSSSTPTEIETIIPTFNSTPIDTNKLETFDYIQLTKEKIKINEKNNINTSKIINKLFNPFDYQYTYFENHKFIPSLIHCKLLSNDEVIYSLLNNYNKNLPDVDELFPWLHGIHKLNYGQISFLSNSINPNNDKSTKVITFDKPTSLDDSNITCDDDDDDDDDENQENNSQEELDAENKLEEEEEQMDDITKLTQTPNARFLMPIRSCNTNGEISPNFTSIINESTGLIKGTVSAEDILISYSNIVNLEIYLQGILPNEVFKFYHPETIITDCIITQLIPVFKNLDPEIGINLRNFHIQVSKISNISDFIVYCFNDEDHKFNMNHKGNSFINNKCKCINLSRLLHIAQIVYQIQHPEIINNKNKSKSNDLLLLLNGKKYNTFIFNNPNKESLIESNLLSIPILDDSKSLKRDDELCSKYDINVFNNWDSNYLYRERLEISKMSTATPLPGNIWLGNITDYECLQIQLSNGKNIESISNDEINKIIKLQSNYPLYCNSKNTIVKLTKKDFNNKMNSEDFDKLLITFPRIIWKFYIKCVEGAHIPTLDQLKLIYENFKDCDFINIEFPPSGSLSLADMSDSDIMSIINICKFCYYICDNKFPGLIYCSDGYTESSLLVLCYLMYSEDICLDEAILKLHNNYGRPFFIFKTDYILLLKLETIMNKFSPLKRPNENNENFEFEYKNESLRSLLLMPKKRNNSVGSVGSSFGVNNSFSNNASSFITNTGHHIVQFRGSQNIQPSQPRPIINNNNLIKTNEIFKRCGSKNYIKPEIEGCFSEVQGSLPSRILKHLYLGSLTHASSIPLLSRLNINYIVSVGEKISWYENFKHKKEINNFGSEIISFNEGQFDELSGYEMNVKKMLILPNINDDGIGTLIETIDNTLLFINECYENNCKVLVHCQVGVSRSATVCIAEVMKRLKLSLARSYMYVRVRRLNVIIQPNLKLMYELFKWEENYLNKKNKNKNKKIQNKNKKIQDKNQDKKVQDKNKNYLINKKVNDEEYDDIVEDEEYDEEYDDIGFISSDVVSIRNDSMSSNTSTIFTNRVVKSERSSISSTTRGNSMSSVNGSCLMNLNGINRMKIIGSICEEKENESNFVLESEVEDEDEMEDYEDEDEEEEEEDDDEDIKKLRGLKKEYDVISNSPNAIREVDWYVLCREIYNLNRAYIKSG